MSLKTINELAEILGLSSGQLRELAAKGAIPAYQVTKGGRYRFDVDAVLAALSTTGGPHAG